MVKSNNKKQSGGASLVAQWLRIRLTMQGTRVRALVREDPTGRGATEPVSHNYRACALEPGDKHYDIRKYRVTGKHGKSEHLSQTCHLQDDCSYTVSTASLVPGVSQQNSSTVFPDIGYLDFSFPDQTRELDSLCTLTCFHIVGIG
ncbi:hypothetical protein J1605_020389 [Eschrichtius robustus]|uniref:Uncharacterized protein n=1 Tax=Eschrichtius robustus TaxID=9764 RepID=A0AB34HJM4_ESCRO|nr:hypothetical protein J1605_020389 [Eschrichtius robustus]